MSSNCSNSLSLDVDSSPAPSPSHIIISDSNTSSPPECQRDHCLSLELALEASRVDNMILKNELHELKEELTKAEEVIQSKELIISDLNGMKDAVTKLYSVAETVLAAMIGSDYIEDMDYNQLDPTQLIDKFCDDLQNRLLEWQENHQTLHNKLTETLKSADEYLEKLDNARIPVVNLLHEQFPPEPQVPGPSTSAMASPIPSTSQSSRRNPVRKCRSWVNSACPLHQAVSSQFSCSHCGTNFCRLSHVNLQLDSLKNRIPVPKVKTEAESPEVEAKYIPPVPMETDQEEARVENDARPENDSPGTRPIIVVVDPSGQEHKFAGSYKTILPSEQMKTMLDGKAPTKALRYFCKCGRHYATWSALYYHVKFIGKTNHFQCGLCEEGFEIRMGMKAHLKGAHKVDYCQGRFACMECGEDFVTIQEVGNHQKLVHKKEAAAQQPTDNNGIK